MYDQLIYDKGAKIIQWRKGSPVNNRCWEKWTATVERVTLDHYFT